MREAAASAFSTLQRLIGGQAIFEIVPALLTLLRSEDPEEVASGQSGLREVMGQRPQAVVPYLLPKLCAQPIPLPHARALGAVAPVAGAALHSHLDTVLPAVLSATYLEAELLPHGQEFEPERRDALVDAAAAVALAVQEDGLHLLFAELRGAAAPTAQPHMRVAAATLMGTICAKCALDISEHHSTMLGAFVAMFAAQEDAVLRAGIAGLDAFIKSEPKERYALHVGFLRETLADIAAEHRAAQLAAGVPRSTPASLPGLNLANGIGLTSIVKVHLEGLNTGSAELRQQCASALGELVAHTEPPALKKHIITITGPLIRIVGDRFPSPVKAAILLTLTALLGKGAILLKPFVPQLQSIFVKALADPVKLVRSRSCTAMAKLVPMATRIDPLATELHSSLAAAEPAVQAATLCALAAVVRGTPKPISAELLAKMQATALGLLASEDAELSIAAASVLGACGKPAGASPGGIASIISAAEEEMGASGSEGWRAQLCVLRVQQSLMRCVPHASLEPCLPTIFASAQGAAGSERIDLRMCAAHALARVAALMATPLAEDLAAAQEEGSSVEDLADAVAAGVPSSVHEAFAELLLDKVLEVRISALHALKTLCKLRPAVPRGTGFALARRVLPCLVSGCADTRTHAKLAAQRTLMHLLTACGWASAPEGAARGGADTASADFAADFVRRTLPRVSSLESEEELSDADP